MRGTIKTNLDNCIVEQLVQTRLKASSALSSLQIAEHMKLIGTVKSLSLGEATVLNDRLSVHVIAQGETSVILKSLRVIFPEACFENICVRYCLCE